MSLVSNAGRTQGKKRTHVGRAICRLCGRPIPSEHLHLLDRKTGTPLCACRACGPLFDRREPGGQRYRLIPDRRLRMGELVLKNEGWEKLLVQAGLCFVMRSEADGSATAFYPGPAGAVELPVESSTWEAVVSAHRLLGGVEPEVEALLARRTPDARGCWLVPIDECFRLVRLVRSGPSSEVDRFFQDLDSRSKTPGRNPNPSRRPEMAP